MGSKELSRDQNQSVLALKTAELQNFEQLEVKNSECGRRVDHRASRKWRNQRAHGKEGSKFRLKSQVVTGCTRFSQNFKLFLMQTAFSQTIMNSIQDLQSWLGKQAQNGLISTSGLKANRPNEMGSKGALWQSKNELGISLGSGDMKFQAVRRHYLKSRSDDANAGRR